MGKRKLKKESDSNGDNNDNDQLGKKRKKIKSFIEYPGGDWIVSAELATNIIKEVIQTIIPQHLWESQKIMLPGVGFSSLPIELYELGFRYITLLDIEETSLIKQRNDFVKQYGHIPESISMIQCDVVKDGFKNILPHSQDIIIDKGFMDVFLRQGSSQVVWKLLELLLKPRSSLLLIFSIFHAKWKRYLSKEKYKTVKYSKITVKKYSTTRPSISSFTYPGAFFAIKHDVDARLTVMSKLSSESASELVDFKNLRSSDFPIDASIV